jgi:hypothetical protein
VRRSDGAADEAKERTSDDHSTTDRSPFVSAAERAGRCSNAEADRSPDQGVTGVAMRHPWGWVGSAVVSGPGRNRPLRGAARKLSHSLAIRRRLILRDREIRGAVRFVGTVVILGVKTAGCSDLINGRRFLY